MQTDCLIIGGGVIGLSLAWELAERGMSVRLVDRQQPGTSTSWAAVGMLPPADRASARDACEALAGLSSELYPRYAERLAEETGIDPAYRRSGAIHLARTTGEALALASWLADLPPGGVRTQRLEPLELARLEPALAGLCQSGGLQSIYLLPDQAQVRTPQLLAALIEACRRRGVEITADCEVLDFEVAGGNIVAARTADESIAAERFCLTGGVWTGTLAERLGIRLGLEPFRGQIVLLKCPRPPLTRMVNEGPRYLVPRDDGHVLVGSTMEEVGFDCRTTPEAIEGLLQFAGELVPELAGLQPLRTWAGLRPASVDGFPFMGALPGLSNAFAAAGHFRAGITMAPGTGQVMSQLICGEEPEIDLAPFRPGR